MNIILYNHVILYKICPQFGSCGVSVNMLRIKSVVACKIIIPTNKMHK